MCAVIIPLYKQNITKDEETSLRQCFKILYKHKIIFVLPYNLNIDYYKSILSEYNLSADFEYFNKKYSSNIQGYNCFMLYDKFYYRFLKYKYLLIYQLDAYVFNDNLFYWCNQDYDYIGSPLFRYENEQLIHQIYLIGGLSLRNTALFYELSKKELKLYYYYFLFCQMILYYKQSKSLLRHILIFFSLAFRKIICLYYKYIKKENWELFDTTEDYAWSIIIDKKGKLAPVEKAVYFSIDSYPEYAFQLTNNTLPFCCHNWISDYRRYFWNNYIK